MTRNVLVGAGLVDADVRVCDFLCGLVYRNRSRRRNICAAGGV